MTTECVISRGLPSEDFWKQFSILWHNSADRSPFKSPHILHCFAEQVRDHLVVFRFLADGELRGTILLKEHKGVYSFLSDMKTDVNFFVLDRRCTLEYHRVFFEYFLNTVKRERWSVVLNNQPAWAAYMPVFEAVGKKSGLFWLNFAYSVCPIAVEQTPELLFNRVNGLREMRYCVSKLKNQEHAEFEVLTDDADLDHWVDEFCAAHVLRWADTPTPSDFRDAKRRQFLKDCLHAWSTDGILVRFAVRVGKRRVGFVIGLLEEHSLVYHSTTFHPDYRKYSPGKALIHFVTQWMKEKSINMLDFGDGNESYKYIVANQEHVLNRIFIGPKANLPFAAKARFIRYVKEHPRMYHLYQNKLKPWVAKAAAFVHLPEILELLSV